jgi:sugar/nucleoside kinase (ribokinase family)
MSPSAAPTVLCAGMAVLDEVFRVERMPAANEKVLATAFQSVLGGCATNAAVAIARLGGRAQLAAALGAADDAITAQILARVAHEGIAARAIVHVPDAATTVSGILIDAVGNRMIVARCDERLFGATVAAPNAVVSDIDVLLVDNWLPDLVVPICAAARERGIPVIMDGDGPIGASDALIGLATHLVFSADTLRTTTEQNDLADALASLRPHTEGFLAVTDGANDILWLDGTAVRRMPVLPVKVVDTLAAGDVFHGAFALALAEGVAEIEALRFAAASAALKCTRHGGGAGAPSRAEVERVLRGHAAV